jgi:hypothetical protein
LLIITLIIRRYSQKREYDSIVFGKSIAIEMAIPYCCLSAFHMAIKTLKGCLSLQAAMYRWLLPLVVYPPSADHGVTLAALDMHVNV